MLKLSLLSLMVLIFVSGCSSKKVADCTGSQCYAMIQTSKNVHKHEGWNSLEHL